MRSFVAAVCGLVATAALLVALPLGWVATHVASEDGYVRFTGSMIDDAEFRDAMVTTVSSELTDSLGLGTRAQSAVEERLVAATASAADDPAFRSAWRDAQRLSHQVIFGDERELDPELDSSDRLVIDVAPLADVVVERLGTSQSTRVEAPRQLLVPVGGANQARLIDQVKATPGQAWPAAAVAAVGAVLALLAARRRAVVVGWLGAGALLVSGLLWLAGDLAIPRLVARNTTSGSLAARAQLLLADQATASFGHWLLITAIVGGAMLVAGLVGSIVQGVRSGRPLA